MEDRSGSNKSRRPVGSREGVKLWILINALVFSAAVDGSSHPLISMLGSRTQNSMKNVQKYSYKDVENLLD